MAKIIIDIEQEYSSFIKDYMTMIDSSGVDEKAIIAVLVDNIQKKLGGVSYHLLDIAGKATNRCRDKSILTEALITLTASIHLKLDQLKINNPNSRLKFIDFRQGLLVIEVT